jgi:hypothetical protein
VRDRRGSCVGILEAEQVAEPRFFFVIFASDGFPEPCTQTQPVRGRLLAMAARGFPHMPGRPMRPVEKWSQATRENGVVVRAAEPALGPVLHEFQAAIGTSQAGELTDKFSDVGDDQSLHDRVQSEVGRSLLGDEPGLSSASGAEVEIASTTVGHLGQVDGGLLGATLAIH